VAPLVLVLIVVTALAAAVVPLRLDVVELAAVEPAPSALRAVVDLDAVALAPLAPTTKTRIVKLLLVSFLGLLVSPV
jgi:hypothetical protein